MIWKTISKVIGTCVKVAPPEPNLCLPEPSYKEPAPMLFCICGLIDDGFGNKARICEALNMPCGASHNV